MLNSTRFIVIALCFVSALAEARVLDGTHLVGTEIKPGVYTAPGGEHCFWSRIQKGDENITGAGRSPVVEVKASDLAFHSSGCGMWTPLDLDGATLYQAANVFLAAIINTVAIYLPEGPARDDFFDQVFKTVAHLMTYPEWEDTSWDAVVYLIGQLPKVQIPAHAREDAVPRPEVTPAMPTAEAAANRRRLSGN